MHFAFASRPHLGVRPATLCLALAGAWPALTSLPGVYSNDDRQYTSLGARGFGVPGDFNARVLAAINGNRVNDPTCDGGPFGSQMSLDLALIERIEFNPGPGGAVNLRQRMSHLCLEHRPEAQ